MRLPRVAAGAALIAVLALVAIPANVGSSTSRQFDVDPIAFRLVRPGGQGGMATAPLNPDPRNRSGAALSPNGVLLEPQLTPAPDARPVVDVPPADVTVADAWIWDREISWYGPGLYGHRTACGYALTEGLLGVAHRTLPCGTLVTFRNPANGLTITVPVVDRGPYVAGRTFDLTGGACLAIGHCWTGPIYWHLGA